MGAALPIALVAVAVGSNVASAYGQISSANESRRLQEKQIRQQQVQLRLQENQASIERMKKLRSVLATGQVMAGARGISGASANLRAAYQFDITNFLEDETADKLNFLGKQVGLDTQREQVRAQRNAQVTSTVLGSVSNLASIAMAAYGMPSGGAVAASKGAGTGASNPFLINK